MTRWRRLVLLAVTVGVLVTATSAYTAVSNDRTVGVDIAPDDGYVDTTEWPDGAPSLAAGESTETVVVRVENQFDFPVRATLAVGAVRGGDVTLDATSRSIASSATVEFDATVRCGESTRGSVSVPVEVTAEGGDGVEVVLDRTLSLQCESPATATPTRTETSRTTDTPTQRDDSPED